MLPNPLFVEPCEKQPKNLPQFSDFQKNCPKLTVTYICDPIGENWPNLVTLLKSEGKDGERGRKKYLRKVKKKEKKTERQTDRGGTKHKKQPFALRLIEACALFLQMEILLIVRNLLFILQHNCREQGCQILNLRTQTLYL
jgi:hypothetical protein